MLHVRHLCAQLRHLPPTAPLRPAGQNRRRGRRQKRLRAGSDRQVRRAVRQQLRHDARRTGHHQVDAGAADQAGAARAGGQAGANDELFTRWRVQLQGEGSHAAMVSGGDLQTRTTRVGKVRLGRRRHTERRKKGSRISTCSSGTALLRKLC